MDGCRMRNAHLLDVLAIDERDDAVEARKLLDRLVHEEGLRDGAWIGEAGGLDHDRVERCAAAEQLGEDPDEVAAHGAADAAVVHLEDVFGGLEALLHERIVHSHLAKLATVNT
jgi:hypothetical protein